MGQVVNFVEERRKRLGLLPTLELIGSPSQADAILHVALSSVAPAERAALFEALAAGTYADMIGQLLVRFEITNVGSQARS